MAKILHFGIDNKYKRKMFVVLDFWEENGESKVIVERKWVSGIKI